MLTKWNNTFERNKQFILDHNPSSMDVVFYGDSITEHWIGTDLATKWKHWLKINAVFNELFNTTSSEEATYNGVPLGIGGDKVSAMSAFARVK